MCIKSVVVDKCATCEDEMKTHIVERPCPKAGGVFEGCGEKATYAYLQRKPRRYLQKVPQEGKEGQKMITLSGSSLSFWT